MLTARESFMKAWLGWQIHSVGPPTFTSLEPEQMMTRAFRAHCKVAVMLFPANLCLVTECSIGVDSVDDTIAAVEANGGKIVMPKFHIPTVGTLIFFEDTEGNVVGAMQYEKEHSA